MRGDSVGFRAEGYQRAEGLGDLCGRLFKDSPVLPTQFARAYNMDTWKIIAFKLRKEKKRKSKLIFAHAQIFCQPVNRTSAWCDQESVFFTVTCGHILCDVLWDEAFRRRRARGLRKVLNDSGPQILSLLPQAWNSLGSAHLGVRPKKCSTVANSPCSNRAKEPQECTSCPLPRP